VTGDQERLQQGFEQFIAAARELEQSYVELKQRTAAVDLELQATNQALQASLREREAIFAALPIGLVAVRDGSLSCCNREGERILDAARAAGVDLAHRLPGECAFGDMLVRVRRVELPDGELVLLEDRSRVQELEREVHRLDRLAGLSELALGIAHEIKNPLNGVMGFAALLERGNDLETMRRHAGKVVQGVRQVDEIVRSLLGFSRPDRGRARTASIATVVAEAAAAAGLPNGRLQLRGDTEVEVDADALVRVLGNLFRNAIEAAPAVTLQVAAATGNGRLELVVQDDGPGIADELGRRAFESTKERGTGLGLPLSARVLSFLGGDLELLNPGQRGARFRVRLPLRAAEPVMALAEVAP
jgi:signal transduction histidine kinase